MTFRTLKDDRLSIDTLHQTVIYVTGTSFKLASTLFQKITLFFFLFFLPKCSKFWMCRNIRFCSNLTSMWSKYLPNNVWRVFRLHMSVSVNIKCPIGKSIFVVNFPLKLLRVTVANADTGSQKTLHTFLLCIWSTCWTSLNQIVWSKMYKILSFWTKTRVF